MRAVPLRPVLLVTIPVALAACGGLGHQTTAGWRLERVEPDGRTLQISWAHGVGDEIERIDAAEAAHSVTITVYVSVFRGARSLQLLASTAVVQLRKPLGDRRLLHGPVNYLR
jgi:hypothetical protein